MEAARPPLAAELPAVTTADLDAWIRGLPASERKEILWAPPLLRQALDGLLDGELDGSNVDLTTRRFFTVALACRTFIRRLQGGDVPLGAFGQALDKHLPRILAFLAEPIPQGHAEKAVRGIGAMFRAIEPSLAASVRSLDELPQDEADLAAALDAELEMPVGDVLRSVALVAALSEAVDRGGSAERGRAPDSATRTRDMLRDWDELLHRLAR